jgi:hypothetical protein
VESTRARSLATVVAVTLTALFWLPGRAGAAPTGSQRAELRTAATGTWTSEFGILEFHDGGTATFTIHNCGVSETRPGFGEVDANCEADVYTGKLTVTAHGFDITQSDGATIGIDAYVDDDGALHVGVGTVGVVGADRTGTVRLFAFDRLKVGDGTCTYVPNGSGRTTTADCAWRTGGGRTVLVYRAPDRFHEGRTERRGLVLVPDSGLLVDPGLVPLVYTRA